MEKGADMYHPGDMIIYGGEGVCRVDAVGTPEIPGTDPGKTYYTLSPLYRTGKVFIPTDTAVFMRPVISRPEAEELVRRIPEIQASIYENRNLRLLNEHYQEILQSHSCEDMLLLIKGVYAKRKEVQAQGKKPGLVDERYMKRAEELLYGELAVALDIPKDEVCSYIAQVIEGPQEAAL